MDYKQIRLTENVLKGGCAAKLPAGQLRDVLKSLHLERPQSLSVGTETMDDACVWNLGNNRSLIQTLDFFTPIVDDAFDFGAIAAANALSDIYAMGGTPSIALSILAFPSQTLDLGILKPLLDGALSKIHEAGACLAGGHTIDDETLKFGLSVSGFVDSDKVWTNCGAKVGDGLILTKALGTGTIATALKLKEAKPQWIQGAIASMKTLNRFPEVLKDLKVHGATDVTGFGLAGHGLQMARGSDVGFEIRLDQLPILEGAQELLEDEYLNRAHKTNFDYVSVETNISDVKSFIKWLVVDPQTSGGLLLAVDENDVEKVHTELLAIFPSTRVIGRVVEKPNDSGSTLRFI